MLELSVLEVTLSDEADELVVVVAAADDEVSFEDTLSPLLLVSLPEQLASIEHARTAAAAALNILFNI